MKRVIEIWTPQVEENPELRAWPPPFTAKGVLVDPKMRSYEYKSVNQGHDWDMRRRTITLISAAEPGSTEHAETALDEIQACVLSAMY